MGWKAEEVPLVGRRTKEDVVIEAPPPLRGPTKPCAAACGIPERLLGEGEKLLNWRVAEGGVALAAPPTGIPTRMGVAGTASRTR